MSGALQSFAGGCLCGRVRYQVGGTPENLCFCHCVSCRRAAGAPLVAWGTFRRATHHLLAAPAVLYRSSPGVQRGHCGHCGTALSYAHDARADEIDIALATLDEPARFEPGYHIWIEDKLPWMRIADGLPQFQRNRSAG
jgi:hypothetical protein